MDNAGDYCPVAKVVSNKDLVEDILQRSGSSVSMIRCRAVCTTWRAATRTPSFARSFRERTKPANVGYIVEFQQGVGRLTKLLYPLPSQGDETTVVMRAKVDLPMLGVDQVVDSRDGVVLTVGAEDGAEEGAYHTSCLWDRPRVYTRVASLLDRIPLDPEQHTVNTFGQFGVLPLAGKSGMTFFMKDAARTFICTYAGVSFCSGEPIFFHVNVLTDGSWVRYISKPIESPEAALFHRNPYSVLDGANFYMMYLVGYIVCFDMVRKKNSKLELPVAIATKVLSWYDYTVASKSGGGLVLVHFSQGMLHKWVLSHTINGAEWSPEKRVDLVVSFYPKIQPRCWNRVLFRETFPIAADNVYSVQVRSSSKDDKFLFLTLGFDNGMYEVNIADDYIREINNAARDGPMGRIYHVAEPWPPAE